MVKIGSASVVASTITSRNLRRESRESRESAEHHNPHREHPASRHPSTRQILAEGRHALSGLGVSSGSASTPKDPKSPVGGLSTAAEILAGTLGAGEVEQIAEKLSFHEQFKFYVSLIFGIIASICVFALLFLIPLVVEPSISTLLADFDPKPALCVSIESIYATGVSKCSSWSSCREGCTSTPSQCHQIYVNYRRGNKPGHPKIANFTILPPSIWEDESRWDVSYTQLLVNAKGCGYPPRVQCEEFGDIYGQVGRTFPCYYSRANPRLVVTDFNWKETAYPLIFSLGLPTTLFTISISVLSFWYCPSCEERGKNKRPCRSRYQTAKRIRDPADVIMMQDRDPHQDDPTSRRRMGPGGGQLTPTQPQPILQQPRKHSHFNSPSLATISSRDTTLSSVSSLDDGWQSPPSPPPRLNRIMNNNNNGNNNNTSNNVTARTRKL